MQSIYRLTYLLLVFGLGCFISCSKTNNSQTPIITPPAPAQTVKLKADAHFGSMLIDSSGRSLYFFSIDAGGNSGCTGNCLLHWPVFLVDHAVTGTGLDSTDFATITRSDGTKQTTYKGWPLYYFQGDPAAGDVNGDAVDNVWFVAKPDYSVMLSVNQLLGNDGLQYDSTYTPAVAFTEYLVDARGMTLYSFTADKAGTNNYTKSDFSNDSFWPMVQVTSIQSVPSTLDKTAFSVITVFGKTQMTYKGWPIYRFGPDGQQRGSTKGVSVPSPGVWPVMNGYSKAAP